MPPEEEQAECDLIGHSHLSDCRQPSSRDVNRRSSAGSELMLASRSQVRGVLGSVVTRREGSQSLGSALLWPPRGLARLGCSSAQASYIDLRQGLHAAKVHAQQSYHTCSSSLVAQARVTQAVCSQACQVAPSKLLRARRRCARTHRNDEKTTSTTTAAALLRRYASPGAARGHRRRQSLPRQKS